MISFKVFICVMLFGVMMFTLGYIKGGFKNE